MTSAATFNPYLFPVDAPTVRCIKGGELRAFAVTDQPDPREMNDVEFALWANRCGVMGVMFWVMAEGQREPFVGEEAQTLARRLGAMQKAWAGDDDGAAGAVA